MLTTTEMFYRSSGFIGNDRSQDPSGSKVLICTVNPDRMICHFEISDIVFLPPDVFFLVASVGRSSAFYSHGVLQLVV